MIGCFRGTANGPQEIKTGEPGPFIHQGTILSEETDPNKLHDLRRIGPVANTDTKLLIYGLFQKSRVLAQGGVLAGHGDRIRLSHDRTRESLLALTRQYSRVRIIARSPHSLPSMNLFVHAT